MPEDALTIPADWTAVESLATRGLRMAVLDPLDAAETRAWQEAVARGFHEGTLSDEGAAEFAVDLRDQRSVGVYDDAVAEPEVPVGTVTSWPSALSLPGGDVDAWAISAVTVAPTHHRRGIARAMLESELRVAVAAAIPVAILTVSEATLYGRYGFGPAAWSASLAIDARRARPLAGVARGRVELISRDRVMTGAQTLLEEARRATPGDVQVGGRRFARLFGSPTQAAELRKRRFLRHVDDDGVVRGFAVFSLQEDPADFTKHTAVVHHLAATTDDAYRALWGQLLELDLVATVTAALRSTDEPLRFLVADQRAIRTTELREHLWVRVLDPVTAFGSRTYAGPGELGLRIADPLGHADGPVVIRVAVDGRATVTVEEPAEGVPTLEVPVDAAGSLLVGGVSAAVLVRAGRLAERTSGDAEVADRLLRSPVTPLLTTWF